MGRSGLGCSLLLSLLAAISSLLLAAAYGFLTTTLPSTQEIQDLLEPPDGVLLQPTRLYDRTGEHMIWSLENPAVKERKYLRLEDTASSDELASGQYLPAELISATLATTDPSFWAHAGFSLRGVSTGEHPTLAQKLVSDLLLWDEPISRLRGMRERLLAAQVTSRYGREKVLEWYLNSANFGQSAFGAAAAAEVYFGKPAGQVNLAEAALLAAILQMPAVNPHQVLPQVSLDLQAVIIQIMSDRGYITAQQADEARTTPIELRPAVVRETNIAPAFIESVLAAAGQVINPQQLVRGGVDIRTSLDYDLQVQVLCAWEAQLSHLEDRPASYVAVDGSDCQAAAWLPTLPASSTGLDPGLQANVLVMDAENGQVLAMLGGNSNWDTLHSPGRSPGTLLTPLVALTGFARGMSPASLVWDIPVQAAFDLPGNQNREYGGPVRLRMALANDDPAPLLQIIERFGLENVLFTAKQLGFSNFDIQEPEEILNGGRVTLQEVSRAMGVFSHRGEWAGCALDPSRDDSTPEPVTILTMNDSGGRGIYAGCKPLNRPLISPELAYLVTDVLSDESARWPSLGHPNSLEIGRPAAAKIGIVPHEKAVWAAGYTPQRVVSVWIGRQDQSPVENQLQNKQRQEGDETSSAALSANAAAGLWNSVMRYAHQNLPSQPWDVPAGISRLNVCDPSGMLPSAYCPDLVEEVFLSGSEPTHTDTLYRAVQVNRESGRLATVFTPPELVVEQVFMQVPAEAQEWSERAGVQRPPEEYDRVHQSDLQNAQVQISVPKMFSAVSGKVTVRGSAAGDDFSFYRIEVGQGLNPRHWLQVGSDMETPVEEGVLEEWDTRDLNGLFALKLLVVRQDQQVETDTIQVTVDNQPPEVSWFSPQEGTLVKAGQIPLVVQAGDNLEVKRVLFYADGRFIGEQDAPPFAVPWQATAGRHAIRAVAFDEAGNQAEVEAELVVK